MNFALVRTTRRCFMSGCIALLSLLCLTVTACGGGGDLAPSSTDATSVQSSSGSRDGASGPGSATLPTGAGNSPTAPGSPPSNPPSDVPSDIPNNPAVNRPTFAFGDLTKTFGDGSFVLNPPLVGEGEFTYSSNTPGVAQISGNTVTIVGAGVATLKATLLTTGQTATAILTVNKAAAGLQLPPVTVNAYQGSSPISVATKSNGALTYVLSNVVFSGVGDLYGPAIENQTGQTAYLYPGEGAATGTITVTQAATANYEGATVSSPLIVQKGQTNITIADNHLHATGAGSFDFPVQITQEVDVGVTQPFRTVVATLSDLSIADVFYYDNGYGYPTIAFRAKAPTTKGPVQLTVSVLESANLAAATKTFDLTVGQRIVQQQVPKLQSIYPYAFNFVNNYVFDPEKNPAITLYTCTNKSQGATFTFPESGFPRRYADTDPEGKTVTLTLSNGLVDEQLPPPRADINSPTYSSSHEFPAGAAGNFTLKVKVSSWGDGTATFYPAAESSYTVQVVAQPPGAAAGQNGNCITPGNQ